MITYKALLLILFNVTCCALTKIDTTVISSDTKTAEIVTKENNTITIFDKCCDDDAVFDVVGKRCVPVKDYMNETTYFHEQKVYIDDLFITLNKREKPFQHSTSPINWTLTKNSIFPKCSEKEILKYFLSESDTSATFLLRLSNFKYDKHLFTFNEQTLRPEHFESFCFSIGINSTSNKFIGTVAITCQPSLDVQCHDSICITSCCPPKHIFDLSLRKCAPFVSTKNIQNRFKSAKDLTISKKYDNTSNKRRKQRRRIFLHGHPQCSPEWKSSYIIQNYSSYEKFDSENSGKSLVLNENGSIQLGEYGGIFNYTSYCINNVLEKLKTSDNKTVFRQWPQVKICPPKNISELESWNWVILIDTKIIVPCLIISILFLSLLLVREFFIPGQTKQLFFLMRFNTAVMLLLYYIILVIVKLEGKYHVRSSPVACEIEGILVQFCYLSVMLWLNSMSFELWSKFRKLRTFTPQRISGGKNIGGWRNPKFKWYAIYSWGLPAFVSFVTAGMQHLPERYTAGLTLPRIGQPSEGRIGTCLIENTWGFLFYIYIISGTSILLSVIFFCLFVWNLFFGLWSKDNQRMVEESSVKNQFDNASVRLQAAIRVFFTLGLIWVCDIASWSLRWRYGHTQYSIYIFISILDIISSLQGVVIFGLIFLDKAMIAKIKKRLGGLSSRLQNSRTKPKISRQTTKLSITQLTNVYNRCSIDNDYVGIRFKNQQAVTDNSIKMEKIKHSASMSTISTVVGESKIDDEIRD